MGPQGKNVIIGKYVGAPVLTKDGVSVAREITLEDPVEEISCQLIKEAAGRTAAVAGDGTTTATILSYDIFKRGNDLINKKYSPLYLKRGFEWAVSKIVENLETMAIEVSTLDTLKSIATISANNDYELGSKIAEAFHHVGLDGTVAAEASAGSRTSVRYVDGIEIDSGYASPGFLLEDGRSDILIENCHILISSDEITAINQCLTLLNEVSDKGLPIVILAKAIKQEALATLVANNKLGRIKVVAVNIPGMGMNEESKREWLESIAALVGTKVYGSSIGNSISNATISDLGFAKKAVIGKYQTKILEGRKDDVRVQDKVNAYNEVLSHAIGDNVRLDIKKRLALLNNKAAIISVGYSTELELREKGDRVDDSICATRAAMEEGFVPGGGTALLRAARAVDLSGLDEKLVPAAMVIIEACSSPITRIVSNAFEDADYIISKILESNDMSIGFNAATGEFEDLVKAGVIDPKKVTRTALQNAASISLLLINTDAIVSEKPNNPSSWQPPAGWRPPEEGKLSHKY